MDAIPNINEVENLLRRLRGHYFQHHWEYYCYDKELSRVVAIELAGWAVETFDAIHHGRQTHRERWSRPNGETQSLAPDYAQRVDSALSLIDTVLHGWSVRSLTDLGGSWKAVIIKPSASFTLLGSPRDCTTVGAGDQQIAFDGCRNPKLAVIGAVATACIIQNRRDSPTHANEPTRESVMLNNPARTEEADLELLRRRLEDLLGNQPEESKYAMRNAVYVTKSADLALDLMQIRLPEWGLELNQDPCSRRWRAVLRSLKGWTTGDDYANPGAAIISALLAALPIDLATTMFYDSYLMKIGIMPAQAANDTKGHRA